MSRYIYIYISITTFHVSLSHSLFIFIFISVSISISVSHQAIPSPSHPSIQTINPSTIKTTPMSPLQLNNRSSSLRIPKRPTKPVLPPFPPYPPSYKPTNPPQTKSPFFSNQTSPNPVRAFPRRNENSSPIESAATIATTATTDTAVTAAAIPASHQTTENLLEARDSKDSKDSKDAEQVVAVEQVVEAVEKTASNLKCEREKTTGNLKFGGEMEVLLLLRVMPELMFGVVCDLERCKVWA